MEDEANASVQASRTAGRGNVPRALTIAGSDSGGGAGIQADLKTFAILGVWGMSAITSITVQNTEGVTGVADIPEQIVADQIMAVARDIGVDAAKTGMLSSAGIVRAVAGALDEAGLPNLVVDPVSVSKHGDPLLQPDAVGALRSLIVPRAALVTPNLPEASLLTGAKVTTRSDMGRAGEKILEMGARAVLVKGGHLEDGSAHDLFMDGHRTEWLSGEWIATSSTHGTGCVLSAAVAAHLALGRDLFDAVSLGKEFVTAAIRHSVRIGRGIGPVSPAWRLLGGP